MSAREARDADGFVAVKQARELLHNLRRGNVVRLHGGDEPYVVVKRQGRSVWLKPHDRPLPPRRDARSDELRRAKHHSLREITHVRVRHT